MDASAAEFIAVTVVAILYHVKEATRGAVSRVIINGKNASPFVDTDTEGIPVVALLRRSPP